MKHTIRILVLAAVLVTGLAKVSAQTVEVHLTQKVPALPATVISYVDDPFRYFNFQYNLHNAGSDGLDIFFDLNITNEEGSLFVRTRQGSIPREPIHLTGGGTHTLRIDDLEPQVVNRLISNIDPNKPVRAQQLPEGFYRFCVDVYRWSDRTNPDREPINTIATCPRFEICYSGSAPELVSPMAGAHMALNGSMVVEPARKLNFFWTPVISNCSGRRNTIFKYKLKVVKVVSGQNYQDAIKYNPTVFSVEVRNNNFAVLDTLRDIKVPMERGELYVAQVQAEAINTGRLDVPFVIANDGKSQPMPFFWGGDGGELGPGFDMDSPEKYGYIVEDESEEGDVNEGVEGVTVWEGGVEEFSELETLSEEISGQQFVGFSPKRHYVESDGFYTVPVSDDLEVTFMPAKHESLKNVSYAIEVYDYIEGVEVDSLTSLEPLLREKIAKVPERYNKEDNKELISRTLAGWGNKLVPGNFYYLQLVSSFALDYWKYSVADTLFYVNDMLAEHVHDTVSRDLVEEAFDYPNGVFFRWGENPEAPDFTAPQWKAPVDRTGDDIFDPANYALPASVTEVKKGTFSVSWTPFEEVAEGDEVQYEVNVYELEPDQTVEEAVVMNEALVTRTVSDAHAISGDDTEFFKVFSAGKTYVMTLSTDVSSDSNAYHFKNGNAAMPVVFRVVK